MIVRCQPLFDGQTRDGGFCGRMYDDAQQWTICPHGPLWAAADGYCVTHDLVWGSLHERGADCVQRA
jgi:hypothetical protein